MSGRFLEGVGGGLSQVERGPTANKEHVSGAKRRRRRMLPLIRNDGDRLGPGLRLAADLVVGMTQPMAPSGSDWSGTDDSNVRDAGGRRSRLSFLVGFLRKHWSVGARCRWCPPHRPPPEGQRRRWRPRQRARGIRSHEPARLGIEKPGKQRIATADRVLRRDRRRRCTDGSIAPDQDRAIGTKREQHDGVIPHRWADQPMLDSDDRIIAGSGGRSSRRVLPGWV